MPSVFSERFRDIALPMIDRWHGVLETVTYTPEGGAAVELEAEIARASRRPSDVGTYTREQTDSGERFVRKAVVSVATADVSNPNVASDTVTFDSLEWSIDGVTFEGGWTHLHVIRYESMERTRPRYRH